VSVDRRFYDGKLAFIERIMAAAYPASNPNVASGRFQRSGAYRTKLAARHDVTRREYR
jgi:hypothetical protein